MDHAGGLGGLVPFVDGPGAAFVRPGGEEGLQAEQAVGPLDQAHYPGFLQPQLVQEHLPVLEILDFRNLRLRTGGDGQYLGILILDRLAHRIHIFIALGGGCVIHIADVHHRLVGEEEEVAGHGRFFLVRGGDAAAGFPREKGLFVSGEEVGELLCLLVSAGLGGLLGLGQAGFHRLQVLDLQFQVHHFLVAYGIHAAVHVHYVSVVEAAEHVQYGIAFADICEELVAQALPAAGTLHQAGDVHDIHRGGYGPLGMADFGEDVEPAVGHVGAPEVGFDGAEGEVGALRFPGTHAVEQG